MYKCKYTKIEILVIYISLNEEVQKERIRKE